MRSRRRCLTFLATTLLCAALLAMSSCHRAAQNRTFATPEDAVRSLIASVKSGNLDFTIDQSPYQQGFLPVIGLYLFQLSGGLVSPSTTNTGLTFVDKNSVDPYMQTTSRFEGSSKEQKLIKRSGAISGG